jgi:cytochrome P450
MPAQATSDATRFPPIVPLPKVIQGAGYLLARQWMMERLGRHYGPQFTLTLPAYGRTVVVGDPLLVKELFTTPTDLIQRVEVLGNVLGPGSTFSLNGHAHRTRRKLMVPPLHGKRMQRYESIVEQEVLREIATWPKGAEFATLQPMMRITLNAILRAVFGAEDEALDELRELLPPWVELGAMLVNMPAWVRCDVGPWSPGGRYARSRHRYDAIIERLIAAAVVDPNFSERNDILTILLHARYEDGTPISPSDIADELLTLLVAGHETTATTLSWAIERIRRHPDLLARLTKEVDQGGFELQQATIWEVQRTRPVIDGSFRITRRRVRLGDWVIPEEHTIFASAAVAHELRENYDDAVTFDPDRFQGQTPGTYSWLAFGGGVYRCIGAAFANMEMAVTLRTLLRELDFVTTNRPAERIHSRGVAMAPGSGGLAVVYRRRSPTKAPPPNGLSIAS